jgi:hypothetical protein
MNLCELCHLLSFENLPPIPECFTSAVSLGPGLIIRQPNVWQHRPERFGFQYHQDLECLNRFALSCPLCSLVHDAATQFATALDTGPRNENGRKLLLVRPKDYRLQITKRIGVEDGFMVWTDANWSSAIFLIATVHFSVQGGSIIESPAEHLA